MSTTAEIMKSSEERMKKAVAKLDDRVSNNSNWSG